MANEKDHLAPEGTTVNYIEERNKLLADIPYEVVKKAWFTLSHLLLDEGAKVVDMGCGEGQMTFAMAALYPKLKFVGVDKSKRSINKARQTLKLPNLEYKQGDVSADLFKPESVDAIVNHFILHEVFSNARYNEQIISDTLRKHYKMLKTGGMLFIHDYAKPAAGQFVLMEMHDKKSFSDKLEHLSEADLLVWYSEHARPKQDPGCGGFFLEELPPRFPKTRLFRLPYKWAYEYMMRKDSRKEWEDKLPYEYTFFTVQDFRRELRGLGARVQYSAPHWDDDYIADHFSGHFRLLQENGDPMGDPATSFVALAQKQPERTSLDIRERRITVEEEGSLKIRTMRDQKNGKLVDVVSRDKEYAEIFPYRITEDGRLNIFLHDGIARGLVNAVPRSGNNIDGRQWSGHMVEPIAVEYQYIVDIALDKDEDVKNFAKTFLGLKPKKESVLEEGPEYYPDPNYIDERVHTLHLQVEPAKTPMQPKSRILQSHHFHSKGVIREFSAQLILDAISVGLIPNSRLELQILSLMQHLKIKAENWTSKDISIQRGNVTRRLDLREYLQQVSNSENRFKEVRGSAGQLKTVSSIFVEEGQAQGGRTGISSQTMDFALSDEATINTAVILPLTISARGDLHAGFQIKHMPVPQRYEGKSLTICAPQINIPKEITDFKTLKQFIAERLNATPEMVIKLGESYYTHIGVTPHRIYPFALAAPPAFFKDPDTKFIPFYQYMLLWRKLSKQMHFMTVFARAYRYLPDHMKLAAKKEVMLMLDNIFQKAQPDWSMPVTVPTMPAPKKDKAAVKEEKLPPATAAKKDETTARPEDTKDDFMRRQKKKKERKERKKMGLAARGEDYEDDPEMANAVNKKHAAASKMDMKLVEEFKNEIKQIKDIMDNDFGPKLDKS